MLSRKSSRISGVRLGFQIAGYPEEENPAGYHVRLDTGYPTVFSAQNLNDFQTIKLKRKPNVTNIFKV
jgi:hypothetical protein